MSRNKNTISSIWKRINKKSSSECWEWLGSKVKGYGTMGINYNVYYVHRLVYELTNGLIPKDLDVLHKCDNPSCCNPDHLFLGTQQDNMRDMMYKDRGNKPFGE